MLPELGNFAIILALFFAIVQIAGPFVRVSGLQYTAVFSQFFFLAFAMLCLIFCFINNDVTVLFVRDHSHELLPLIYRIGASWGGHEGSLLLWCLILSGWTAFFLIFSLMKKNIPNELLTKIIMVLGYVSTGFILFLFSTSNPFKRDFPTEPISGNDLTPILQDPGLIFHPPMLYLGYVGFAIAFAFAVAVLLEGRLEKNWAHACRPWVIMPWSFLSCGIVLGSWWAYRELGWGGWWFWDPVENASLLPWLAATGLLHSLIVCEKREAFKGWTLMLAIITFALCFLGTFLVRSGVIVSVHAFANDPDRGVYLLGFMAIVIGSALVCYLLRIKHFYQPPKFQLFSRETFLLLNSVVLISAVATIVIGTLYPIVLEALNLEKISVGEPYFNTVFVPIMLPALFFMGLAPHVSWGQQTVITLWKKMRWTLFFSLLITALFPIVTGFEFHVLTSLGIFLGIWIIFATLQLFFQMKNKSILPVSAMMIAHIGIAILVLGMTLNKSYSVERQVKMLPGESVNLAGYQFTLNNIHEMNGPNYQSIAALFNVQNNRGKEFSVTSEQRIYLSHNQAMSKAGILVNMWRDLYLALGTSFSDGAWSVRIYYKPFVRWIWCGGFMLLLGGFLSLITFLQKKGERHEAI